MFFSTLFTTTFINITEADVSSLLEYTKAFISDITPFMIPIIAVGLGLIILAVIIKAIRG